ncbi:MAG: hypothetical protein KAW40_03450 [Candidatus Aenigmarchaeota archaeon]|nr:hypothetical protein [Candidatus Aenigmarchaeota archaeon]
MKLFKDKSKEIKELQPGEPTEEEKKFEPPVKLPEIKKAPLAAPRPPAAPVSKSPPLFIKVDKYRDIVENIRNLKSYILNLRDAIDVLEDMQKEISNGIDVAHKTLDELNIIISNLDSFFLRPQGVEHDLEEDEIPEPGRTSPGEVEGNMKNVYTNLERLRAQLRAIQ